MNNRFLTFVAIATLLPFGSFTVRAQSSNSPKRRMAPPHDRPIIEHEGKTLLWASGRPKGNAKWFDVTGATIDPKKFQYGIGVDRIPSVDKPRFAHVDDERLPKFGITGSTVVIGYADGGEAKAYPVNVLDKHELVNDHFLGKPITVGW